MRRSLGFLVVGLLLVACTSADQRIEASSQESDVRVATSSGSDCIAFGDRNVEVPDVIGLGLSEAIEQVRAAGLIVVGSGAPPDDPIDDAATVVAQEPAAGVAVATGACVGLRTLSETAFAPELDSQPRAANPEATEPPVVQVLEGFENVESSVFALGSVWAATSNRPDRFSQERVEASVIRVDPVTGLSHKVLDSPGVEPSFSELDGKVWVRLADRLVALDTAGAQGASILLAPGKLGDMTAGGSHLWVASFDGAAVSVIDPVAGAIVRTLDTGDFPVSPTSAFGHIWVPSSIDGTVTIIDEGTQGETTHLTAFVIDQQLEDVTPVPNGMTGAEVWITTRNGDVFAITAHGSAFGHVRQVEIAHAINRVHIHGDRAFLLPIAGRDVIVLDIRTEVLAARIPTESIPFRAVVAHDLVWVTGDGMAETLTVIDPQTLSVRTQFEVGSNESKTNGPHTPVPVGDKIWVPNRGDGAFFIVDTNQVVT